MDKQIKQRNLFEAEMILENYNKLIFLIEKELEDFKNPQIKKYYNQDGLRTINYIEVKSEAEKKEEIKERAANSVSRAEEGIFRINRALEMVADNEAYKYIKVRFLETLKKRSIEETAEILGVSTTSVYKMRNKIMPALIFHLKIQGLIGSNFKK